MQEQAALGARTDSIALAHIDLSIIIVNWNVRDILLQNLHELFQGNPDAQFEVIVIDNASTDGSVEAIRKAYPQVTLIANQANRGFAAAVNQGLERKSAGHVLLLNPDMRVDAGVLARVVHFLDAHPKVGVLSGKLINEEGKPMHHARRFPDVISQLAVLVKLPHLFPKLVDTYHGKDLDLEQAQSVDSVRGSFFAIQAQALERIGHFDEGYFIWFEEVDFCRRAKAAGYDVYYAPDIIARDLIGKSFAKRNLYWKQKQFSASMIHYFKKWHPRWQSLLLQVVRPAVLGVAYVHDAVMTRESQKAPISENSITTAPSHYAEWVRAEQKKPKLAIQVVLFNSSADLPALLSSLREQTFKEFEVFFYHNFDSFAEMHACKMMVEASGLSYRYITAEDNIGFDGGHAWLYRLHQRPYVMLLNDDVRLAPAYLERAMQKIESHAHIGSLTGLIYRWDEKTIDTTGLEYKCLAQIVDRFAGTTFPVTSPELQATAVFGVSGAVGLYRRSAIEKAGGLFDPMWFMYKEDVDLALRLRDAGYSAWFEPMAIGYHKRGLKQSTGLIARWRDERKRPAKLRIYAYANQLKIYKRHFHWSLGTKDILHSLVIEKIRSIGTFLASPSVFYQAWKIVWKS